MRFRGRTAAASSSSASTTDPKSRGGSRRPAPRKGALLQRCNVSQNCRSGSSRSRNGTLPDSCLATRRLRLVSRPGLVKVWVSRGVIRLGFHDRNFRVVVIEDRGSYRSRAPNSRLARTQCAVLPAARATSWCASFCSARSRHLAPRSLLAKISSHVGSSCTGLPQIRIDLAAPAEAGSGKGPRSVSLRAS